MDSLKIDGREIYIWSDQEVIDGFWKMENVMALVDVYMLMVMYMRAISFKIKSIALVSKN